MLTLQQLDAQVPIQKQLSTDVAPVTLINVFTVDAADVEQLMAAWEHDANWMKMQLGYISTQLHRGIGGSTTFLNYAVWESVAHFRAAFSHPDFMAALAGISFKRSRFTASFQQSCGCEFVYWLIGPHPLPHRTRRHHRAIIGKALMVVDDVVEIVEIIHHQAVRLREALCGNIAEKIQPLQPRAIAEMEAGDRVGCAVLTVPRLEKISGCE